MKIRKFLFPLITILMAASIIFAIVSGVILTAEYKDYDMIRDKSGTVVEKEYLAKAVVQAQELISGQDQTPPPPPEQSSTQTQEDQLPRRRSPRR